MEGLCHTVCGFLSKRTSAWLNIFSLTKTIAAKQQKREDDTSFILYMAVDSNDSLEVEKKLCRGGDQHGEEERERERQENKRENTALVLFSIYGLFIYAPLSGFLPPTSAEDSH